MEITSLKDEDLIRMNVGTFTPSNEAASVIGNASISVAGAAGETAKAEGIPAIVIADGPPRLPLSQKYFND